MNLAVSVQLAAVSLAAIQISSNAETALAIAAAPTAAVLVTAWVNHKKIDRIEVNVDGRMSEALDEITRLRNVIESSTSIDTSAALPPAVYVPRTPEGTS